MGRLIAWYDQHVRLLCHTPPALRVAGVFLALGLPGLVYLAATFVIEQSQAVSSFFGGAVTIGLAASTLAGRDLWDHVRTVSHRLAEGDLIGARRAVSLIVGRDTEQLSEPEVVRATVETIAESTADGVIAPLVYLSIGGAPLALAYKAINTLDSMVGHRGERHEHLGWAAARLDDAANWIPARLTAALISLAAVVVSGRWERGAESSRIVRRDGHKHPSPNSGRPEAAMAGALGVQLGGINVYDGRVEERQRIGDDMNPLTHHHIPLAARIMTICYGLGVLLAVTALWLV
jgi:adenosylcobinamide-phosphate synthase